VGGGGGGGGGMIKDTLLGCNRIHSSSMQGRKSTLPPQFLSFGFFSGSLGLQEEDIFAALLGQNHLSSREGLPTFIIFRRKTPTLLGLEESGILLRMNRTKAFHGGKRGKGGG